MSKQGETNVKKKILDYLKDLENRGLPFYHETRSGNGGFNQKKGVPDIWFTYEGLHVECEVKTEDGHLSTMQEGFRYRCINIYHNEYINPHSFKEFKEYADSLLTNEAQPH